MWDMVSSSFSLLIRGRLFREPGAVLRQWAIGFGFTILAILGLVKLGVPLWLSVALVSLAAGALQPLLFKNLKYA